MKKKVLLSAFSCNPFKGSEESYGWNWSIGLVDEGFEVHTFTRIINKKDIEAHPAIKNLHFHYIMLPLGLEKLYSFSQLTMYLYYILWQWFAYIDAKKLSKIHDFYKVHHVTWGSIQQGSFLYKLKVPFIFGPAGGGQKAPIEFKSYFKEHWSSEIKREKVSDFLCYFNPACKNMLKNAELVMVSNNDTLQFAKKSGAKNIKVILDTALSNNFFPPKHIVRKPQVGKLKLLWVGRFLPRKGILLTLEVMNRLKEYPGITLTIVGDGEMMNYAKEKYIEYELYGNVNFVGAVSYEQVKEFYTTHDAFFFTSLRESGGVQLVEAMAYSLPIITLNLHGQGQIVSPDKGIKVSLNTPDIVIDNLANEIISLSNNPDIYIEMSKSAYNFAKEQVWDKKIKNVVENLY